MTPCEDGSRSLKRGRGRLVHGHRHNHRSTLTMGNGAPQSLRGGHSDSRISSIRLDGLRGETDLLNGAAADSSRSNDSSTVTLRYNAHDQAITDVWKPRMRSQSLSENGPQPLTLQALEEVTEDHNSSASSIKAESNHSGNNHSHSPRMLVVRDTPDAVDAYEDDPFEDETFEWRKGEALGSGSYGTVYLARDERTGALMAVKEILIQEENEDDVRNASREVELLQSLRHPNIVKYLGSQVDHTTRRLHIFTEWVPGGNLEQNRRRFGGEERVVRRFTRQILHGVAYLHSKHVVHHDIKPSNLLVDQFGVVKLADFGSSRLMSTTTLINNESMRGTPNYMAPEVIKQSGPRSFKSDIWSVGCSVLRLLTGRSLWGEKHFDSQIALLYFIAHMEHLPALPTELSDDAKSFITRCLDLDPTKRPTADELLMHPFVSGDTVLRSPIIRPLPQVQATHHQQLRRLPSTAPTPSRSDDVFHRTTRGDSAVQPERDDHDRQMGGVEGLPAPYGGQEVDEDSTHYTFSEFTKTVNTRRHGDSTRRTSASGTNWEDQPILTDAARADRERRLQIQAEEKRKREERERRFQEELVEFRELMLRPQTPQEQQPRR